MAKVVDIEHLEKYSAAKWWTPGHTLMQWWQELESYRQAHLYEAKFFIIRKNFLGSLIIIISAINGSALIQSFASINRWKIYIGISAISAAILAGLQSSLKDTLRADEHKKAAAKLGNLQHKIEQTIAEYGGTPTKATLREFNKLIEDWEKVEEKAPVVSPNLLRFRYWRAETASKNKVEKLKAA